MNKKTYLEKYQKIVDLIAAEFPETDKCKMVINVQYSHDWHDCTAMKGYTETSSNPNKSNKKKNKKNKDYTTKSKDDILMNTLQLMTPVVNERLNISSILTKKGRELNRSNSNSSEGILPELFDFPENSLVSDYSNSSQGSFFKYFIDLFFNRKRVLKFIDDLNIEMLSVDECDFTISENGFIYISNSITYFITITPVMRLIIYRDYKKGVITFHIRKKDYIQLRKIIEIKIETKKMNKLYNEISKL